MCPSCGPVRCLSYTQAVLYAAGAFHAQVMHDSALAVRRPGECTFFKPGCEISVDKVEFTPEMVRVRGSLEANRAHSR